MKVAIGSKALYSPHMALSFLNVSQAENASVRIPLPGRLNDKSNNIITGIYFKKNYFQQWEDCGVMCVES